ncbi:hypothetical protein FACS1894176_04210 [Bacteroidia bacterium]|nr:hypothetical protein FACS1894176_04210 [Bacteroidia bacterium]
MVLTAYAQFSDNFSDGAFTGTGRSVNWSGDVDKFVVNDAGQLQLNAAKADTVQLRTPSTRSFGTSWEFYVKMDFALTASNNYARIYLISDGEDLIQKSNGLFIQIGGNSGSSGSGNFDIHLWRARSEANNVRLISSVEDRVKLPSIGIKIKVTLDNAGNLNLYSQLDGESEYTLEGNNTVTSEMLPTPQWFGMVCSFSGTHKNQYYFDDFEVQPFTTTDIPSLQNNQSISIQYPGGGESLYNIHYQLDKAGYTGRLFIYDTLGRLVDTVRNNELLNSQGEIPWSSSNLHSGVYIVFLEVFDKSGTVHQFKTPMVVK